MDQQTTYIATFRDGFTYQFEFYRFIAEDEDIQEVLDALWDIRPDLKERDETSGLDLISIVPVYTQQ